MDVTQENGQVLLDKFVGLCNTAHDYAVKELVVPPEAQEQIDIMYNELIRRLFNGPKPGSKSNVSVEDSKGFKDKVVGVVKNIRL